jgi:NADPH-dependent 2,4-dienoyl-CoA reductase/sulfur reductase-like enzyme
VVVGIGVVPATGFLEGVSLNEDGSVDVDGQLRLAENVYAAGDVARYPDPFTGARIRIEHWRLAQQHGRIAAAAMAGKDVSFESVPFFWTRQFGVSLMVAGCAAEWDEVMMTGDAAKRDFTAYYAKNDRLVAAAGTQDKQIAAFMERMRTGQLPSAAEIRAQASVDLLAGLKHEAGVAAAS